MGGFLSRRTLVEYVYAHWSLAAVLAGLYLGITALLIFGALQEGVQDGAFMVGFALMATLPLSLGVRFGYDAIATALDMSPDGGPWELAVFAACAAINALVIWVIFRGRNLSPRPVGEGMTERATSIPPHAWTRRRPLDLLVTAAIRALS